MRGRRIGQRSGWSHASARRGMAAEAGVVLLLVVLLVVVVVVCVSRRTITARCMCMTNHVHRL